MYLENVSKGKTDVIKSDRSVNFNHYQIWLKTDVWAGYVERLTGHVIVLFKSKLTITSKMLTPLYLKTIYFKLVMRHRYFQIVRIIKSIMAACRSFWSWSSWIFLEHIPPWTRTFCSIVTVELSGTFSQVLKAMIMAHFNDNGRSRPFWIWSSWKCSGHIPPKPHILFYIN